MFSAIRSLQAEITKLKNTFKYGLESYQGKQTAMSNIVGELENDNTKTVEPLWGVDEHTLSEITGGNLDVVVDVRTNREFASLSDDINSTVTTLKGYIAEAAARIDKELEFAKQIQYSSLPMVFPNKKEFEIYAMMITAKEVGGDFYDFYMLNDNTVAFLVADVSGKGIPAAMFMMRAKTIIKDLAESGLEIDEIFTRANDKLCENNDAGMFVTVWMAILDLQTGMMKYANAGHNPPLIRHADGQFEYVKTRSGMVMAGMEGIKYKKNEMFLLPGDKVLLYTDGVTEATALNNELYSEARLVNFVNSFESSNAEDLCKKIKNNVDEFVGSAPQFDDITLLALTLKSIKGSNHIVVMPNENSRQIINSFGEQLTLKLETVPKVASKINIIIDEIYSNIVNYSKATLAEIGYSIENGQIILSFVDNGIPYNPLEMVEPDITLSAEERDIGGLGIFIVKKMANNVEYKYEEGKNILNVMISLN
jgi:sigma-B regulation protein RsbU (phosphoserine phosphatase)